MGEQTVSIIIPMFNAEEYIGRCLDSIIAQSYSDIEIIIVDDGSTDDSFMICQQFKEKTNNIKVVRQKNSGCSRARSTGIKNSTGAFIGFVDSDDWIESRTVEELVNKFNHREDVDVVVGGYVIENERQVENPFTDRTEKEYDNWNGIFAMFEAMKFNWSMCDKLYRKSLFDNLKEDDYWRNSYGEDTYKNYKLLKNANEIIFAPIYGYHYCINLNSMMRSSFTKDFYKYIDIYNYIFADTLKEKHPEIAKLVGKMLIENALYYLKMSLDTYNRDDKTYREYINLVYDFMIQNQELYQTNKALLRQIEWLRFSEKENKIQLEKQKNEILEATNENGEVWIYGAGVISKEVCQISKELKISFSIIVSEKKTEYFEGGKVYSFEEAKKIIKGGQKILLAMNKNNCEEVITAVGNEYNLIDIGKFSYHY